MVVGESCSAKMLCVDGMYCINNFSKYCYSRPFMAATNAHTKRLGGLQCETRATTLQLSEYNFSYRPGNRAAKRSTAINSANNSSDAMSSRGNAPHPSYRP